MIKHWVKKIIRSFPVPLSKNHAYDLLTEKIIKSVCQSNSNCIDVGCHRGEIMDIILKYAPNGHHTGFEPLPEFYERLKHKYRNNPKISISDFALSDHRGTSSFNYVISNPAYSGIKKRKYDREEKDTIIEVKTETLDEIFQNHPKIDLIKIDVEGGEYQVLRGAESCIRRDHPVIIFEHGKGASDIYGTQPDDIFDLFQSLDYSLYSLDMFLQKGKTFQKTEFKNEFYSGRNYYFVANINGVKVDHSSGR